jgi:thiamine-monophosphate kinase
MGEFDLIERFFKRTPTRVDVGIGDDCAIWSPRSGHQLAISADMLVDGCHFLSSVSPRHLGHKALAVNLSDLAACGAQPQAFLLSVSLPRADEAWLQGFSEGLFKLADEHACELIGGDTTQGPLNIAITVLGDVPIGQSILRSGAQSGDDLYVSGHLGDARLALEAFRGHVSLPQAVFDHARLRMETPTPRVALGQALRGIAHGMADISDGLIGDLKHILKASHVGAEIDWGTARTLMGASSSWSCPENLAMTCVLSGGDDYELVFTASPADAAKVQSLAQTTCTRITRIGCITGSLGIVVRDAEGQAIDRHFSSFDHFTSP